jgi:hypothetical protein
MDDGPQFDNPDRLNIVHGGDRSEPDDLRGESSHSHVAVLFPNTVRDGGSVDLFLVKGLPNPSLVQRIAAWMLGLVGIACGSLFVALAIQTLHSDDHPRITFAVIMLVAAVPSWLGLRTFRLGFRKRQKPVSN